MNRRKFIKTLGLGAAVLSVVSMLGKPNNVIYPIIYGDLQLPENTSMPMIGSVTDVNGCTVIRIEQGDKLFYFTDAFTEYLDGENLHWDNLHYDTI